MRYGWRASFFVFGLFGAIWAGVWYVWFRDSPAEKAEGAAAAGLAPVHSFPLRAALRSPGAMALMSVGFCYVYVFNFFQTWFHTFLVRGRGFSESGLLLSALPFVLAGGANLLGGAVSDALVGRIGRTNGRRVLGVSSLAAAGLLTIAAMVTRQQMMTLILLALVYSAVSLQQAGVFGVCLDIGRGHAGAVTGLMNTASQVGAFISTVSYGYIVDRFHSYNAPFVRWRGAVCRRRALVQDRCGGRADFLTERGREEVSGGLRAFTRQAFHVAGHHIKCAARSAAWNPRRCRRGTRANPPPSGLRAVRPP